MCFEDFRDALKAHWAPKDVNFLTLKGDIDIGSYQILQKKVLDKNMYIFTYKSKSGFDIKIELVNDRLITKQLIVEHPLYFPFWRMFCHKIIILLTCTEDFKQKKIE